MSDLVDSGITVEDIRAWRKSPVTEIFLSYIRVLEQDCDTLVHRHLEDNKLNEAAFENAGMRQLKVARSGLD